MNAKRMMTGPGMVLGTLFFLLVLLAGPAAAGQTCPEREAALQEAVTVQDFEQFIAANSPCELAGRRYL